MKINIDYDGSEARCSITTIYGHPDVFVDFNIADEYSQVYAMNAFKSIIENWKREGKMKLSEYKIGDKVDIYVFGKKRPATVTNVSEESVEVELDNPMHFTKIEQMDFIVYLEPETYMKRFLVKHSGIIDRIKED